MHVIKLQPCVLQLWQRNESTSRKLSSSQHKSTGLVFSEEDYAIKGSDTLNVDVCHKHLKRILFYCSEKYPWHRSLMEKVIFLPGTNIFQSTFQHFLEYFSEFSEAQGSIFRPNSGGNHQFLWANFECIFLNVYNFSKFCPKGGTWLWHRCCSR